jgi:hypothetical protein
MARFGTARHRSDLLAGFSEKPLDVGSDAELLGLSERLASFGTIGQLAYFGERLLDAPFYLHAQTARRSGEIS